LEAKINFSVGINKNYPCKVVPSSIMLNSGQSVKVRVSVKTDSTIESNFAQRVMFTAYFALDVNDREVNIKTVEIVPTGVNKKSGYHMFPVKVGVSHGMQRNSKENSVTQITVSGEGVINDGSDKYFKFGLKGPDAYGRSIFFEHEEYFALFRTNRFNIHIGDKSFTLSPLLEHFRYGRGVEAGIKEGKFTAGGYAFKTRWLKPNETQKALYLNYIPAKGAEIGLNLLNKKGRARHGTLFSIHTRITKFAGTNIDAEIASGEKKAAYQIHLTGKTPAVFYSLNLIAADKDFPGYYTDTRFFTAALTCKLRKDLQLMANYRQEHQNFEIDTTEYSAPFSKYGKIGVAYRPGKKVQLFGDMVFKSRKDRMPISLFDYREISGRFSGRYKIGPVSFTGSIETGKTYNKLLDSLLVMYRYMASIYLAPGDNFSARSYLYVNINNRYSMKQEQRVTFGLNLRYKVAGRTSLILNYQNNYSREEYFRNRDLFEASLNHTMSNGHVFSAKARYSLVRNTFNMRETSLLFSYMIPVSIPVGKKHGLGVVKGKIYNAEDGVPFKGVIVRMANVVTVTNKNGEFAFPPTVPGEYLLNIDKSNLGMNTIGVQKMPLKLSLLGGEEKQIVLGITKAATLSGRILLFTTTPDNSVKKRREIDQGVDATKMEAGIGPKLYPSGGVPEVIVELKKDNEVKRWFSDKDGYFYFDNLRPGNWELKIFSTNIPDNFKLEKSNFEINLKPLEKKEISVRVIPRKRKIKILQQGGVLIEEDKNGDK
ncbi:carboxypeptidase regulatory-like domain-containing protein, partial [bacterium]|nr:carboxypeptidase regulatory-like domain-containing protein [bacterium]